MSFSLRLFPSDTVVADRLPGPPPAMTDVVVVDGARWRVLEVEHRYSDSFRGERLVEHVCIVEREPAQAEVRRVAG